MYALLQIYSNLTPYLNLLPLFALVGKNLSMIGERGAHLFQGCGKGYQGCGKEDQGRGKSHSKEEEVELLVCFVPPLSGQANYQIHNSPFFWMNERSLKREYQT